MLFIMASSYHYLNLFLSVNRVDMRLPSPAAELTDMDCRGVVYRLFISHHGTSPAQLMVAMPLVIFIKRLDSVASISCIDLVFLILLLSHALS